MLTALILPMIVLPWSGGGAFHPKIAAAIVASAVAWATRSTPKTIAAGMASLWLAQWAVSRFG